MDPVTSHYNIKCCVLSLAYNMHVVPY